MMHTLLDLFSFADLLQKAHFVFEFSKNFETAGLSLM
jgi:hypothetical protein